MGRRAIIAAFAAINQRIAEVRDAIRRKLLGGRSSVVAALCGAAILALAQCDHIQRARSRELDRSLNQEGPITPRWISAKRLCDPPNAREVAQDAAMVDLARTFASAQSNPGLQYVVSYFSWHWPLIGQASLSERNRCPPAPELYERIAPILEQADWLKLAQERNDMRLLERLPPSRYIAKQLGRTAFHAHPLTHDALRYDNRPYLRMLLAYQGAYARPWAKQALAEIAPDTKLGTSAAFLAVATVPEIALPRVSAVMRQFIAEAEDRQVLDLAPPGRGFTIRDGDRLYELANALSAAGQKAEPYSDVLVRLLDERFASGSHFGLILLEPEGLCPIARYIGGRAAAAANAKPYCNEDQKD